MAPELFQEDAPHSSASDLWSLGCVLYECASGHPPFVSTSFNQLVRTPNFAGTGTYCELMSSYRVPEKRRGRHGKHFVGLSSLWRSPLGRVLSQPFCIIL